MQTELFIDWFASLKRNIALPSASDSVTILDVESGTMGISLVEVDSNAGMIAELHSMLV